MSKGTPIRGFRVEDELWEAAIATSKRRGENLADVLRAALRLYANDHHPKPSDPYDWAGAAHIANCPQCQETFR